MEVIMMLGDLQIILLMILGGTAFSTIVIYLDNKK